MVLANNLTPSFVTLLRYLWPELSSCRRAKQPMIIEKLNETRQIPLSRIKQALIPRGADSSVAVSETSHRDEYL